VIARGESLSFPESLVQMLSGYMGQPPGGWPADLQRVVLKEREAITVRPGELLPPIDFAQQEQALAERLSRRPTRREVLSDLLFPGLVGELEAHREEYGDTSVMATPTFFYGLRPGEETAVQIEPGKTLIIKLINVGDARPDGTRDVLFELNGQAREVRVADAKAAAAGVGRRRAAKGDARELAASMPGKVLKVLVSPGDRVARGVQLVITEAMKMETVLTAPYAGTIREMPVKVGDAVEAGDLLVLLDDESGPDSGSSTTS
jgi:pyruvate carboxylase